MPIKFSYLYLSKFLYISVSSRVVIENCKSFLFEKDIFKCKKRYVEICNL